MTHTQGRLNSVGHIPRDEYTPWIGERFDIGIASNAVDDDIEYENPIAEVYADTHEKAQANARRLAACWNACDGIPTEILESMVNDGIPWSVHRYDNKIEAILFREIGGTYNYSAELEAD